MNFVKKSSFTTTTASFQNHVYNFCKMQKLMFLFNLKLYALRQKATVFVLLTNMLICLEHNTFNVCQPALIVHYKPIVLLLAKILFVFSIIIQTNVKLIGCLSAILMETRWKLRQKIVITTVRFATLAKLPLVVNVQTLQNAKTV